MSMHPNRPGGQSGATLVVALIFLVLLTMIGITVATNSVVQERMAGNTRQKDLAFQWAESALQDAETAINDSTSTLRVYMDAYIAAVKAGTTPPSQIAGVRVGSQGAGNDAAYWQNTSNFNWADGNCLGVNTTGNLDRRYVVDYMASASTGTPAVTRYYYRITARGKSGDAVVVLQTMYKFE